MSLVCPSCGDEGASKFCVKCGTKREAATAQPTASADGGSVTCGNCGAAIPGGKKFCLECGVANQAVGGNCAGCGKSLSQGAVITAMQKQYHKDCFVCGDCAKPVTAASYTVKAGKPWCDACDAESSSGGPAAAGGEPRCGGCKKLVSASVGYITPNDIPFHPECFTCTGKGCSVSLQAGYVYRAPGRFLCKNCADPQLQRLKEKQHDKGAFQAAAAAGAKSSNMAKLSCLKCYKIYPVANFCPVCGAPPTQAQLEKAAKGEAYDTRGFM
eukprot:g7909.t1